MAARQDRSLRGSPAQNVVHAEVPPADAIGRDALARLAEECQAATLSYEQVAWNALRIRPIGACRPRAREHVLPPGGRESGPRAAGTSPAA